MQAVSLQFIEKLLEECAATAIGEEPPAEVTPDDVLIAAEASDNLKRIFSFMGVHADKISERIKQGRSLMVDFDNKHANIRTRRGSIDEIETEEDSLLKKLEELKRAIDQDKDDLELVSQLFWKQVRHEHPELRDKRLIGIRKGWKLCWTEEKFRSRSMPDIEVISVGNMDELKEALKGRLGRVI